MFRYRRNANGDSVIPVKPFTLNAAYAATAKRFDVVKLDASSEVVLAAAGDAQVLGVLEYIDIKQQGATVTTGGVRISGSAIYEAPATAAGAKVGTKYGINVTDGGTVNVADTTTTCVVVVAVNPSGTLDVQITGRQLA